MVNITNVFNATSIQDFTYNIHVESGGVLGPTLLFVSMVIFLMAFIRRGTAPALAASGFINILVAILLWVMNILPPYLISIPSIIFMAALISTKLIDE